MKLRNKETGEIGNFCYGYTNELCVSWQKDDGFWGKQEYSSLAELSEEWEDYEEPKLTYWIISENGTLVERSYFLEKYKGYSSDLKEIGNYFETKEEAEKAVEKLKAWKRLKDKGFRFIGVKGLDYAVDFEVNPPYTHMTFDEYTATEGQKEFYNDLMLLFGGEE